MDNFINIGMDTFNDATANGMDSAEAAQLLMKATAAADVGLIRNYATA